MSQFISFPSRVYMDKRVSLIFRGTTLTSRSVTTGSSLWPSIHSRVQKNPTRCEISFLIGTPLMFLFEHRSHFRSSYEVLKHQSSEIVTDHCCFDFTCDPRSLRPSPLRIRCFRGTIYHVNLLKSQSCRSSFWRARPRRKASTRRGGFLRLASRRQL